MKHWHHIIPVHVGGTDDPSNLVELTVEEHAAAHKKLFEEYGRWEDELAYKGLTGIIGHEEAVLLSMKMANIGRKHTEERKAKRRSYRHTEKAKINISKNHKGMFGKKHSIESRKNMSLAKIGTKHSEETKLKMSLSNMGEKNPGIKYRGKSWIKDATTGKRVWL